MNTEWTPQELEKYLGELESWLKSERSAPSEGMEQFFAKRLNGYDQNHLENWPWEYENIARYFDDGLGSLLDIGCGTGLELDAIFKRFPAVKVTGIDLSSEMLGRLKEKYREKDVTLIEADYFEYPFERERFDAAISVETLHHFKYDKKQEIYNKLYSALKGGGYYIECDYYASCEREEQLCLEQYEYKRRRDGIPDGQFVHIDIPLTLEHQLRLMKNAGFTDICVVHQNLGTVIVKARTQ